MDENRTQVLFPVKHFPDSLRASAASVTGTREYQEDCLMYQVLEDGVLGVVCDGMGGLSHGERSSACAVDSLAAYFKHRERAGVDFDHSGSAGHQGRQNPIDPALEWSAVECLFPHEALP